MRSTVRCFGDPKDTIDSKQLKNQIYLLRFGHTRALLLKKKGHEMAISPVLGKLTHMWGFQPIKYKMESPNHMVNHHLHLMTTWLQGVLVQPSSKLVLDAASIWKGQMRSWNTWARYVVLKCPWLGFAMHRLLDELTLARTASTALLEPDQFYSQIFPQSYPFTPEVTNFLAWKSYASSISFASLFVRWLSDEVFQQAQKFLSRRKKWPHFRKVSSQMRYMNSSEESFLCLSSHCWVLGGALALGHH